MIRCKDNGVTLAHGQLSAAPSCPWLVALDKSATVSANRLRVRRLTTRREEPCVAVLRFLLACTGSSDVSHAIARGSDLPCWSMLPT